MMSVCHAVAKNIPHKTTILFLNRFLIVFISFLLMINVSSGFGRTFSNNVLSLLLLLLFIGPRFYVLFFSRLSVLVALFPALPVSVIVYRTVVFCLFIAFGVL